MSHSTNPFIISYTVIEHELRPPPMHAFAVSTDARVAYGWGWWIDDRNYDSSDAQEAVATGAIIAIVLVRKMYETGKRRVAWRAGSLKSTANIRYPHRSIHHARCNPMSIAVAKFCTSP